MPSRHTVSWVFIALLAALVAACNSPMIPADAAVASGPDSGAIVDAPSADLAATPPDAQDAASPAADAQPTDAQLTDAQLTDAQLTDVSRADLPTGDIPVVDASTATAARLVYPLSGTVVTRHRPRLRWALGRGDGASVEICRDRACATVVASFDVTGTDAEPPTALGPGVYFWRLFERTGTLRAATPTASWRFRVDRRDTAVDTAWSVGRDVDNDGFDDILLSVQGATPEATSTLVFLGGAAGPRATPSARLPGFVTPLGDVNGDGFGDALLGTRVHLGGPSGLSPTPSSTLPPRSDRPNYAALEDTDGDGYADLMVTAGYTSGPGAHFEVFPGGPSGITPVASANVSIDLFAFTSDSFGQGSLDVNGDRRGDVVVAVNAVGGVSGTRVLLSGSTPWRTADMAVCVSEAPSSAEAVGDVNGDGYADVVARCGGANDGTQSPYTFITPGGPHDGVRRAITVYGFQSVSGIGDVNGDGFSDLLVIERELVPGGGARTLPRGTIQHGGAGATITTTVAQSVDLTDARMIAVGDVNRDGFDDALRIEGGVARFLPGSASGLTTTATVTLSLAP